MKEIVSGAVMGVVIALIGSLMAGNLAAISTHDAPALAGLIGTVGWQVLIVQLPAFGVLAFVLVFLTIKFMKLDWRVSVAAGFIVAQAALALQSWPHLSLHLSHVIPLATCMAVAGYVASLNLKRNNKLQAMR